MIKEHVPAPELQLTLDAAENGNVFPIRKDPFVHPDFNMKDFVIFIFTHMGDLADPPVNAAFFKLVHPPFDMCFDKICHVISDYPIRDKSTHLLQRNGGGGGFRCNQRILPVDIFDRESSRYFEIIDHKIQFLHNDFRWSPLYCIVKDYFFWR